MYSQFGVGPAMHMNINKESCSFFAIRDEVGQGSVAPDKRNND